MMVRTEEGNGLLSKKAVSTGIEPPDTCQQHHSKANWVRAHGNDPPSLLVQTVSFTSDW